MRMFDRDEPMKISRMFFLFAVLLLCLSVAGCGNNPTPTPEPPAATHAYPPPMNDPEEVAASLTAMPEEEVASPPAQGRGGRRRVPAQGSGGGQAEPELQPEGPEALRREVGPTLLSRALSH